MDTSRYPTSYYNGNVMSSARFFFLWSNNKGCTSINSNFNFSISLESPMTSYDNSMPTYRYNPNYGTSYQTRPIDASNYANVAQRPNYSYGSNPNYGYSNGQRYEPRPQQARDVHPHYYSERNVMSF